eukprot:13604592-Ditylum_brightwellii.AAC.1
MMSDYMAAGSNLPAGVVFKQLKTEQLLFEANNKELSCLDWCHHGSLVWDSCAVKDKLVFNSQTMELVGFADKEALDISIIKAEILKEFKQSDGIDGDGDEATKTTDTDSNRNN